MLKNNRKLLLSVTIVALVGGVGIIGTFAYMFARRTVETSRFTAGTVDLDVSANGVKLEPFVVENLGENANISGTKTWTVKNTGSLPGRFLFRLQGLSNKDNGCNDQEKVSEPACESDDNGELGNVINLKIALDGVDKVESTLATANEAIIGENWSSLPPIILASNESKTLTAYWSADENSYGNEVQSDSINFNADFRLMQIINGPTPTN